MAARKIKHRMGLVNLLLAEAQRSGARASWVVDCLNTVGTWLARGDGVAVYRNVHLGHPLLGHRQFVSYGSHEAQLEVDCDDCSNSGVQGGPGGYYDAPGKGKPCGTCNGKAGSPPERLPDIGHQINWRYTLEAYYRPGAERWTEIQSGAEEIG